MWLEKWENTRPLSKWKAEIEWHHFFAPEARKDPWETRAAWAQLFDVTTATYPPPPCAYPHRAEREQNTASSQDIPSHGLFDDVPVSYPLPGYNFLKAEKILPKKINTPKQLSHSLTYLDYRITMKSRRFYWHARKELSAHKLNCLSSTVQGPKIKANKTKQNKKPTP